MLPPQNNRAKHPLTLFYICTDKISKRIKKELKMRKMKAKALEKDSQQREQDWGTGA